MGMVTSDVDDASVGPASSSRASGFVTVRLPVRAAPPRLPHPVAIPPWHLIWARAAAPGLLLLVLYFGGFEVIERVLLEDASKAMLHAVHLARGIGAAMFLATWAFFSVRRMRARVDAELSANVQTLEHAVHDRTRELEDARAFTELLFDSLRERILVLDHDGRVVKANRVASELAGMPLLGQRCSGAFPACAAAGGCLAQGCADAELATAIRPDGEGRLWDIELIPVPGADGRPELFLEVGRDVTRQKSLEAQVLHQEKMAGLGVLTAGFAHDLGNPLASLASELELLEDETDATAMRASLAVLRNHVGRMSRTLREMVDFARRRRDELGDVSVADVVADTVRLVRHDQRWKRVSLSLDVPLDLPSVHIVEDHLVLVLLNLMLNAADAMPDGGNLSVSARSERGAVKIAVRDTGVGMTDAVRTNALKPLFTTKTGSGGTGLGLSVSNDVVRAAGGHLYLDSRPGEGTLVEISLPAARPGGSRG